MYDKQFNVTVDNSVSPEGICPCQNNGCTNACTATNAGCMRACTTSVCQYMCTTNPSF